jgi:hypothetical protein
MVAKKSRNCHTVKCPTCTKVTEVNGGDICKLPVNYLVQQASEGAVASSSTAASHNLSLSATSSASSLSLQSTPLLSLVSPPSSSSSSSSYCSSSSSSSSSASSSSSSSAAVAAAVPCELCDSSHDAVSLCLECKQNMCEAMTKAHRKMLVTASHRIVSLTERSDAQLDPSVDCESAEFASNMCPKHPHSKQEVFDMVCGEMLCTFCLMEHRECFTGNAKAIQSISEASSFAREWFRTWDSDLEKWSGHMFTFLLLQSCSFPASFSRPRMNT